MVIHFEIVHYVILNMSNNYFILKKSDKKNTTIKFYNKEINFEN